MDLGGTGPNSPLGTEGGNEVNTDNKFAQFQGRKNPLELNPVIRCVLQYLNVDDVKKCRYLSKEWSTCGLLVLKIRSMIVFKKGPLNFRDRTPSKFLKLFPKTSDTIPFTAFKFSATYELPWYTKELTSFFESQCKAIRELILEDLNLRNQEKPSAHGFDITPWLLNSPMTKPNTKYHTKLSITASKFWMTLEVSISALVNIKEISLVSNIVHLEDGIKMNPRGLKLFNVLFHRNGKKVDSICTNEIVDLSELKKMRLKCCADREDEILEEGRDDRNPEDGFGNNEIERENVATTLSLEMNRDEKLTFDYLYLWGVKIVNWKTCRWTVHKLSLWKVPLLEGTDMEIGELYFYFSKIDFSVLPSSIEKLAVDTTEKDSCSISVGQSVFLPSLISLHLKISDSLDTILSYFVNCPLVDLHLQEGEGLINFDNIPNTVKKLKFTRVGVITGNRNRNGNMNLEKLIVEDFAQKHYKSLQQFCCSTHFKTKELVLSCGFWDRADKTKKLVLSCGFWDRADIKFLVFLKRRKKCLNYRQRFYVGPFYWNTEYPFKNSYLVNYVDRESKYYVFEKQKGKAISRNDFLNLQAIEPNENLYYININHLTREEGILIDNYQAWGRNFPVYIPSLLEKG